MGVGNATPYQFIPSVIWVAKVQYLLLQYFIFAFLITFFFIYSSLRSQRLSNYA
jgi:hypothetical protein